MVGPMAVPLEPVEASCAICGAPPFPECPHEGERLELAINQAMERWGEMQRIRDWVLNHARNQVIATFQQLRAMRVDAHRNYIQTLPYYTLYQKYNGNPPLERAQLQLMHSQIQQAQTILQQGVDQDWRTSCLRYPEVLDYYFSLVRVRFPADLDDAIQRPVFGMNTRPPTTTRRVKDRRNSVVEIVEEPRRRERRRSRTRETPPPAPMAGSYRKHPKDDFY